MLAANALSPARFIFGPHAPQVLDKATDFLSTRVGSWVMDKLQR